VLGTTTRIVVAIVATLLIVGGLGLLSIGAGAAEGLLYVIGGAGALIALAIERNRYRSEAADRSFEPVGPGGGEPAGSLEPRFRRTDETFVDPTTGVTMRVFVDRTTGDRRYLAEG
jgi:hypothetical protein